MQRPRTKILATLGPATDAPGVVEAMAEAGMDGGRINTAHDGPEQWRRRARMLREASETVGRPLALLVDLAGPKLRLPADLAARDVEQGESIDFVADATTRGPEVGVGWPELVQAISPGLSEIVVGDGTPRFRVVGVSADGRVTAACMRPGRIEPRKGLYVTHVQAALPAMTDRDRASLDVAAEVEADLVALSFVRSGADLRALRGAMQIAGSEARAIAKIEKLEAHAGLSDILAVSDGVMVARGDLGVEAGVARVPILQKDIIHAGVNDGKLVITATQMLESMVERPEPTRAEAADVANAILDGTSAVMLSGETTIGRYPVESVRQMAAIAGEAQSAPLFAQDVEAPVFTRAEAVMQSAVLLARQIGAAAMVIPTATGGSARAAAKYRPSLPIVALCESPAVARQLSLEWGVVPALLSERPDRVEERVESLVRQAVALAEIGPGGTVVVAYGSAWSGPGSTNVIVVREVALPMR